MDLAKLRARLQALRNMTTANGCTEAEALAAAEKAAELLAANNLSDLDLDAPDFDEIEVRLGGRRTALDDVWIMVAAFADCTGWLSRCVNHWRFVYFGRASDVLIAEYVHEVLKRAADTAVREFRASESYQRRRTAKTRSHATKAFLDGFCRSVKGKLAEGLWRRKGLASGQGIIALKQEQAALRLELERRGKQFRKLNGLAPAKGKFRDDAQWHGRRAGNQVSVDAPLAGAATSTAMLPAPVGRS